MPQSCSMKNGKYIQYSHIFHTFARVKISRRISLLHYAVLPLFQCQMVVFQCGANVHGQERGNDDGNDSVEGCGGQLGDDGGKGGGGGKTFQEQSVIEVALGQVQQGVGQRAGHGGDGCLAVAPFVLGLPDHQTHRQAVSTLGQEGDPAFGDVQGIGHVIDGGAKTGGQTAQPGAQQQAAEGAHDVAKVEGCGARDVDGQGNAQGGASHGQGGHQRHKYDFSGGEFLFLFHLRCLLGK